ncbi:putative transcriptional regulator [Pelagibacter phage HTVC204P]|nr:putative transcriptional regulator [Pelagibacter phage HTVC204P]
MNTSRGFLHITYKLYHHMDILEGEIKSTCLNVFLSVMKYCWKKNGYRAGLRHSSIEKDTGLSRATVKRCLETLNKLNIIKSIRGRSGKTYIVNEVFLKAEKTYEQPEIAHRYTQDSSLRATLEEHYSLSNSNNKIQDIIVSHARDKTMIVKKLSELPIEDLQSDKTNTYYCKLAIEMKQEDEANKNKTYVHGDKIIKALSNIRKQTNPRYKAKVEYNKRNGIKPWENK